MTSAQYLARAEIGMLHAAINWTLHTTFSKTPAPRLKSETIAALEAVLDSLAEALHSPSARVAVRDGRLHVEHPDQSRVADLPNICACLRAMDAEIGHSPDEVRIVTNESIDVLRLLLTKLAQDVR